MAINKTLYNQLIEDINDSKDLGPVCGTIHNCSINRIKHTCNFPRFRCNGNEADRADRCILAVSLLIPDLYSVFPCVL